MSNKESSIANKAAEEGELPALPELSEDWILSRGMTYSTAHMIDYARQAIAADRAARAGASEDARDAARYRFLRDPAIVEDFPPADGSCWVVEYRYPKGTIPELRSAGFGIKLDAAIDLAMEQSK